MKKCQELKNGRSKCENVMLKKDGGRGKFEEMVGGI
jgi:hypothetical protein